MKNPHSPEKAFFILFTFKESHMIVFTPKDPHKLFY